MKLNDRSRKKLNYQISAKLIPENRTALIA